MSFANGWSIARFGTRALGVSVLMGIVVGCAATPLQVKDTTVTPDFMRYRTLVVKDFENAVGDTLPANVPGDLAQATLARLTKCYPGAFEATGRDIAAGAEGLVVTGRITEYRTGSRFARAMLIGLGSAKLVSEMALRDGQSGDTLDQATVDLLWAMGGIAGASRGIEDLVKQAGAQMADHIARRRGATKAQGC